MKVLWAAMLCCLFVAPLQASEALGYALLSGFESWHSDNRDELNPHNPGLGLRFPDGYSIGAYHNSIGRQSLYAGKEWQWRLLGTHGPVLNIGGVLGLVSGYQGGKLHPLVIPELVLRIGPLETVLLIVPRTTKTPVTLALQLRWLFE